MWYTYVGKSRKKESQPLLTLYSTIWITIQHSLGYQSFLYDGLMVTKKCVIIIITLVYTKRKLFQQLHEEYWKWGLKIYLVKTDYMVYGRRSSSDMKMLISRNSNNVHRTSEEKEIGTWIRQGRTGVRRLHPDEDCRDGILEAMMGTDSNEIISATSSTECQKQKGLRH